MTSAGSEDAAGQALAISIVTPKLPPGRAERWISPIQDEARTGGPGRTAGVQPHSRNVPSGSTTGPLGCIPPPTRPHRRQSLRACLSRFGRAGEGTAAAPFLLNAAGWEEALATLS